MMSKYEDVLKLRQKILSQLRETKSLTQLQVDGIIMSSDFWLSQEKIEEEFVSDTWHYLLLVEVYELIPYLNLELSEDEKLIEKYI
ncbi:hypothetical protein [Turicibacter sanguinis]|uniref:hypothetical protein n=2 Tax=Turicibacter sanguinis TaxID=154288 RepID=UPI0021D504AE|nr:hypothetical protein [Turicibacter sanguinis]MCU7197995.1 hypothetical protein [Turicibacter sanguinis]MDB8576076.1 hypothetical protein [Turicibacter sanguinis]MDB8578881.1 hypothetical protein [Turicibacter sanguinis]MDB8584694.1 hypothetical protein [Turicibacter sanguinis]MDB8587641.1 hypothetical protein [Turicibacter sanguinis]